MPSFGRFTCRTVTQCGPSPALHPSLPCCSPVAWQPELNIGPHSPNFPSSPSKAFLSSPRLFLFLLPSSSYSFLLLLLSLFLFLLPFCQFPMVGTLGISDEEMENIPQTAQAAVVKGDFHNESLDDPVKESAGWLCVHPHSTRGARSSLLFIHSAWSTHLFRGLLLCRKLRLPPTYLMAASSQGPDRVFLFIRQTTRLSLL